MANTQARFGFKHIGYLGGGAPDYQMTTRAIQSTNASTIGFGDPVGKTTATSAYIVQATQAIATSGLMVGVFVGCQYTPAGGIPTWSPYWPGAAAVDATAYIIDAPNALFLAATLLTAVTTGNIGQCVQFTTGTPATTGGAFSIATIDQASLTSGAAGTTLPFKIVQLYQGVGNGSDPTTNYNWAVVTFNNQYLKYLG